ncbi:hypothetical protein JKY72_04020 [Candidatus Gracilibacteria bacterium]|nr:hypothetical protein [Candidatus Gracilibacteria bacterium]
MSAPSKMYTKFICNVPAYDAMCRYFTSLSAASGIAFNCIMHNNNVFIDISDMLRILQIHTKTSVSRGKRNVHFIRDNANVSFSRIGMMDLLKLEYAHKQQTTTLRIYMNSVFDEVTALAFPVYEAPQTVTQTVISHYAHGPSGANGDPSDEPDVDYYEREDTMVCANCINIEKEHANVTSELIRCHVQIADNNETICTQRDEIARVQRKLLDHREVHPLKLNHGEMLYWIVRSHQPVRGRKTYRWWVVPEQPEISYNWGEKGYADHREYSIAYLNGEEHEEFGMWIWDRDIKLTGELHAILDGLLCLRWDHTIYRFRAMLRLFA